MRSLKEWVREKEIWKIESWREFVEQLQDTLREARKILKIDKLFEEVAGKEIGDITDERLKEKVMTALLGGMDSPEKAFSKFMYERFGIRFGEVYLYAIWIRNCGILKDFPGALVELQEGLESLKEEDTYVVVVDPTRS